MPLQALLESIASCLEALGTVHTKSKSAMHLAVHASKDNAESIDCAQRHSALLTLRAKVL